MVLFPSVQFDSRQRVLFFTPIELLFYFDELLLPLLHCLDLQQRQAGIGEGQKFRLLEAALASFLLCLLDRLTNVGNVISIDLIYKLFHCFGGIKLVFFPVLL